ncbi:MAG TPA: FHA domain-containing protein, partial [Magnetospirillaceae bacterium]|nr:FHA domain-containing protein [Magnetospirillaceae bacterium]
ACRSHEPAFGARAGGKDQNLGRRRNPSVSRGGIAMSLVLKRVVMSVLGLLGAMMLWPVLRLIQHAQGAFPSYLTFTLAQGVALGLLFGALFGSLEGIVVSSRPKAFRGAAFGAIFGAGAGAAGTLAGQLFLFLAGDALFRSNSAKMGAGLALANGIAWVLIGTFLAMTEGMRARSPRKLIVGLLGGLAGGLTGGAALSGLQALAPGNPLSLLAALALFGFSLSLFYSLFENRFQAGALKLLNGHLKGKEYPLVSRRITMGSDPACDIVLSGYPEVRPRHAVLTLEKGRVFLKALGPGIPLQVNDRPVGDDALRPEDVVAAGKAKFLYGYYA